MIDTQHVINNEQQYIVQTYVRPDFVLVRGDGVRVFDADDRAYIDWVAGIAVNILGYGDAGYQQAIEGQLATGLVHTSNLYHSAPHGELAQVLCENSFADQVFFCNSGTEANEAAIKFARKYAYHHNQPDKTQVVCFTGAFHGRTMGSLAITPRDKYQKPFEPLMPDVVLSEFNNIQHATQAIGERTCAVIVEPIQGEGGIHPANTEFLQALRDLCDEYDALLIFDEVQCGLGRTGYLWAHEPFGVQPDMMTAAKPLAGGLPIGATLITDRVGAVLQPGDHASTFAGGLLVTAAAKYIVDRVSQSEFLAHVCDVGNYLRERLEAIEHPIIQEVRGRGLMLALDVTVPAQTFIDRGYERGVLLVSAGTHTVRFVPPLIIEKTHVDHLIATLVNILEEIE